MLLTTLVGKKFGCLTVQSAYRDSKRQLKCIVICDCGTQKECYYSNLKAGRTKSCGHLEKMNREKYKEMVGLTFNQLKVIEKTKERKDGLIIWKCRCTCGRTVLANRKQLIRGYVKCCGYHELDELIQKKYGELTIQSFSSDKCKLFCKCSCGNELWVEKANLLNGHTRSCGHLKLQKDFVRVDGAAIAMLQMKLSKANTSGHKGVSKRKNGKWVAYISLRGQRFFLGEYSKLKDAVMARKNAEEQLFVPLLKKAQRMEFF